MSGRSIPVTLALVVLIVLTLTSEAQARWRLPMLITMGEKVLEIADIREVMKIVKCPWSTREITRRMDSFVAQVKNGEHRRLLDGTCKKLRALRGQGKERLLEASLHAVATADGIVDEAEKKVSKRLMNALSPVAAGQEVG